VFVLKPELSGLLEKLGIARVGFARGDLAEISSVGRRWTEKERRAVERQVEAFYEVFIARVAEGRKLPREKVEAAAGGRVWTGRQALERALVDRVGSLGDAVALAAQRAGIARADAEVRRSEPDVGFGEMLSGALARSGRGPLEQALDAVPEVRALALLSEMGPVLALPLEWVLPPR
jgi:protease-4